MAGPLAGVKVLDFTTYLPGPFCVFILADLGADTIKVERTSPKEGSRPHGEAETLTKAWDPKDRNKRSISLDLKSKEGKEIFLKLAAQSDVLVVEGRPHMPDRLGLAYEDIKKINPKIIYCHISGFGFGGPYEQVAGFDPNYVAVGGVQGQIGYGTDGIHVPTTETMAIGDMCGGSLHGAIGIISALYSREKTGKGQFIDTACADGVAYIQGMRHAPLWYTQKKKIRRGSRLPMIFECKDGKFINFSIAGPYWEKLCRAIGMEKYIPDGPIVQSGGMEDYLPDPVAARRKEREIVGALTGVFLAKTRAEWLPLLMKADACVSPVNEIDELFDDPNIIARKMVVELDHPKVGKVKQVGIPFKMSETQPEFRSFAPLTGENTEEILHELGYTKAAIKKMMDAGLVKGAD
jgi:crotonobetainyl-CoA:carnitine CoA-transferase CaiB-like acyl-CoA transferase